MDNDKCPNCGSEDIATVVQADPWYWLMHCFNCDARWLQRDD